MEVNTIWTFKTSFAKILVWFFVITALISMSDVVFDANMYVSLVKSIVKYTSISDC